MGRPVPQFWWDFHWENNRITAIRVENTYNSNFVDFPIMEGSAESQIEQATQMIEDYKAGRKNFR